MSTFDTSSMAAALPEAANGNGPTKLTPEQLRERGWVAPESFDYEAAMAKSSNAAGVPATVPILESGGEEIPGWAHNARKYEWKDEYGDVGPPIPELELQLFQNQNLARRGGKFEK